MKCMRESIITNNEEIRGQGATLVKPNHGVKRNCQGVFDQDGEGWVAHTLKNLADPTTIEPMAHKI